MHDLSRLRKDPSATRASLASRNVDFDLDDFLARDDRRRELIQQVDALKAKRNEAGKKIGEMKKAGESADDIIAEMGAVSDRVAELDTELGELEATIHEDLLGLPNLPHESVPIGSDESENTVQRSWGTRREFDFKVLDHVDIGEALRARVGEAALIDGPAHVGV